MSSSENNSHITITHSYMTKSNLQEIVYDGSLSEISLTGGNEPEGNNAEKNKPADKQEISLQEEVGILLDDIEISSVLAFKTAKEVLPENIKFLKDSKHALGRAATVFISYLSAIAQEFPSKTKRKQVTPMDIYSALESIGFPELVSPLKEYLDIQKEGARAKKANLSLALENENIAEQATVEHMEE